MVVFKVELKKTAPIEGQKPGTSGLRKKVTAIDQLLVKSMPFSFSFQDSFFTSCLDFCTADRNISIIFYWICYFCLLFDLIYVVEASDWEFGFHLFATCFATITFKRSH